MRLLLPPSQKKQKRKLSLNKTKPLVHTLLGEELVLLPEKCIYWKSKKCLLIADVHLGKVDHFRKNGIAIPSDATSVNYTLMSRLFNKLKPSSVIFLGDLFHSDQNKDYDVFGSFVKEYHQIEFILIKGNHDIIEDDHLETIMDQVVSSTLQSDPFIFSHEPLDKTSLYNLCGHIHPAIRLKGKGLQSVRLPCFYFGKEQGILPAFGSFTGGYTLDSKGAENIFIVAENEVIPLRS